MAGIGKKVKFHGAFKHKPDAVRKERAVGGWIEEKKIKGNVRYIVMTERAR